MKINYNVRFYGCSIILCLLSFLSPIFAQSNNQTPADSLQRLFDNASTDTARLALLFKDLPYKYCNWADPILVLYQRANALAQRIGEKNYRFRATMNIGLIYMYCKSDEGTAFQWFQKALVLAEELQNPLFLQRIYYAIGIVHHHQNNRQEMYKAFYKAIDYAERNPQPDPHPFEALKENLYDDKRIEENISINKRFVLLLDKTNAPIGDRINAYCDLANALQELPNHKAESTHYWTKAKQLSDTSHWQTTTNFADDLLVLASINRKLNRTDDAIKYANQVLAMTTTDDFTLSQKGEAHKLLSDIYEEQKNYPLSMQHLKANQIYEQEQWKKHLTDDAAVKVIRAESERDLLLKQQEVNKQKWVSILGFTIVALMLVGGFVFYRFYKREQERKNELATLNTTKDRLFALLSHDLLSPIANMKNIMMLVDWDVMSADEFKKATKGLTNDVNNIYGMLENVLHWSISQMRGIKTKREKVNVKDLVEEQIGLLEPIAKGKGIHITHHIPSDFEWTVDKNHLALILRNLLQNALKFTNTSGSIQLKSADTEGGKKLSVQDTGIGMPPEVMDKLFKVEQNAHREGTAQEGGTGLGLILTKELVELNGGQVDVSSEIGKGTTFMLTFL